MIDLELIIKVPEEEYEIIKACTSPMVWTEHLIKNGTPLNDVLDKIKSEIMQLYNEVEVVDYDHNDISRIKKAHWIIREEVLWILDKYSSYPKRGADMREGEE